MPCANGTPKELARIGSLQQLVLANGTTLNFDPSTSFVGTGTNHKLYLVGEGVKMSNKVEAGNYGEIAQIDYLTQKKHINGNKPTYYYHEFGEENGIKPELHIDKNGFPKIVGGDYRITDLGIAN